MSRIRWDDLPVLLAVSRTGSFTAAASRLGVEQSTVSRRIAALEDVVGQRLFDRTPSGLIQTQLCTDMVLRAEGVEGQMHQLLDLVHGSHGELAGRVRIAVAESFAVQLLIPRVLPAIRSAYPSIELDLVVGDHPADLLHREVDLALRFFRPRQAELVIQRIARVPTAVLARRDYARRHRGKPAEALAWIALDVPGVETVEERYLQTHVRCRPALRTSGYLAQTAMVQAGLGVALLARPIVELDRRLVVLDVVEPQPPALELWLTAHRAVKAIPRVAAVWSALRDGLAAAMP